MKSLVCFLFLVLSSVLALAEESTLEPSVLGNVEPSNERVLVTEFTGDSLDLVFRTLARQARVNIVVSSDIQGTVNLRLENKTRKEIMQIIARANDLTMEELNGVIYIRSKAHPDIEAAKQQALETKRLFDALIAAKFTREEAMKLVLHFQKLDAAAPAKVKTLRGR